MTKSIVFNNMQSVTNFKSTYSKNYRFFSGEKVSFYFIDKDDTKIHVATEKGTSLLEVAHENGIDLEGACDSSLACSTCHVI